MVMSVNISQFENVAKTFAAIARALENYTLIDRLAHAVNINTVIVTIHDFSRNLDALKNQNKIVEVKNEKRYIIVETRDKAYKIYGRLANDYEFKDFIENATKNILVARAVAARAMSIAALAEAVKK